MNARRRISDVLRQARRWFGARPETASSSESERRRAQDDHEYEGNPLPLKAALLAALSGLWPRRDRPQRKPAQSEPR